MSHKSKDNTHMSTLPKLSIGIPCYDDPLGVQMTVQAIRLYHWEVVDRIQILVVDNNPFSKKGRLTEKICKSTKVDYSPYGDRVGTAPPRELIFKIAEHPYVLVMDSHVMLLPGALANLLHFYSVWDQYNGLLTGPRWDSNLLNYSTHYEDRFRNGMWGTWARLNLPHSRPLETHDIPGMGLGLFSCRKAAWVGFSPHFTGFGGTEWYIYQKFQKAGKPTQCLSSLGWWHRFEDPEDGRTYPNNPVDRITNYIIGQIELGESLVRVYAHFVDGVNEDDKQPKSTYPHFPSKQFDQIRSHWNEIIKGTTEVESNKPPSFLRKTWNYAKALARHTVDGLRNVPTHTYEHRLSICDACDLNENGVCQHRACGCNLEEKARWRSERCPLNPPKWDRAYEDLTPEQVQEVKQLDNEEAKRRLAERRAKPVSKEPCGSTPIPPHMRNVPAENRRSFHNCTHDEFHAEVQTNRHISGDTVTRTARLIIKCNQCGVQMRIGGNSGGGGEFAPVFPMFPPEIQFQSATTTVLQGGCNDVNPQTT